MPSAKPGRKHLHSRTITCEGYVRDDGLWEVEARLVDQKPFAHFDFARGHRAAGDSVHDMTLRIAVDDARVVREIEVSMESVPFAACREAAPRLQELVGETIGAGWRERVRQKVSRKESCTHSVELLGPAVTTLFQMIAMGANPEGTRVHEEQRKGARPFYLGGCHSRRLEGPQTRKYFPDLAR
jgi:hypothetical protein